jgi:hypothetical protein
MVRALKKQEPVVRSFCHNIIFVHMYQQHEGRRSAIVGGVFVPICGLKLKVSQNGRATDCAAGFHLNSVAIVWPRLGPKLTCDMLSNERAAV